MSHTAVPDQRMPALPCQRQATGWMAGARRRPLALECQAACTHAAQAAARSQEACGRMGPGPPADSSPVAAHAEHALGATGPTSAREGRAAQGRPAARFKPPGLQAHRAARECTWEQCAPAPRKHARVQLGPGRARGCSGGPGAAAPPGCTAAGVSAAGGGDAEALKPGAARSAERCLALAEGSREGSILASPGCLDKRVIVCAPVPSTSYTAAAPSSPTAHTQQPAPAAGAPAAEASAPACARVPGSRSAGAPTRPVGGCEWALRAARRAAGEDLRALRAEGAHLT
jgi:hypothetical protein